MRNFIILLILLFSYLSAEVKSDDHVRYYCKRQIFYYNNIVKEHESRKNLSHEEELKYHFCKGVLAGYNDILQAFERGY